MEDAPGVAPGMRVAVAVGSRGIAGIGELVAALAAALKARGASPFVVPAMGSHGGDSAEGERATLASLGITEESAGVPVVCADELTLAGRTESGLDIWADAAAWAADGIVPINRVKPHTAFRGEVESGPAKLLAVGLGKARSAELHHRAGLARSIPEAAGFLLASGKVPFGLAVLENGHGETAEIVRLTPLGWLEAESRCLARARGLTPRLPWDDLDLLIVERMGKEISGTGMDIHVIGFDRRFPGSGAVPRIGRVVALDLTEGGSSNANGVGYADVVTRRLADRADWELTRTNARVTGFARAALCPAVAEDEEAAIRLALAGLPVASRNPEKLRAVRIRDTAHLTEFLVTPALLKDLPANCRLRLSP